MPVKNCESYFIIHVKYSNYAVYVQCEQQCILSGVIQTGSCVLFFVFFVIVVFGFFLDKLPIFRLHNFYLGRWCLQELCVPVIFLLLGSYTEIPSESPRKYS